MTPDRSGEGLTAADYIDHLGLERHLEGGWFRRVWSHPERDGDGRALASSIHYLLEAGERSRWHRIDATETWCWHAGSPLRLSMQPDGGSVDEVVLGPVPREGHRLQATVSPNCWQAAELATSNPGDFALVSCLVVPEFRFEGFELAPQSGSMP